MDSLFFILERMHTSTLVPIRCVSPKNEEQLFSKGLNGVNDIAPCLKKLISGLDNSDSPLLEFADGLFCYGGINDSTGCRVIFGPVCFATAEREREKAIFKRIYGEGSGAVNGQEYLTQPSAPCYCELSKLSALVSALFFIRRGIMVNELDIITGKSTVGNILSESKWQSYVMNLGENEVKRLGYTYEQLFFRQIREGKSDMDDRLKEVAGLDNVGRMANSTMKQFEYMVCSAIVLGSRAAIEGGVDSSTAYTMSDIYLQRLEKCKTPGDMFTVEREARNAFSGAVKITREQRSKTSHVEKCKTYIANHLNRPFSLDNLADAIGINKTYLSRLFSDEVGLGIMAYTRQKRIEAAANMLKYSDESIADISGYLCFPSQSHFGHVFKNHFGLTPLQYRNGGCGEK